jgi:threonine dehydratase
MEEIRAAADRLRGVAIRTPLLHLDLRGIAGGDGVAETHVHTAPDVYLKPESLQPIGSFKLRGSANAMAQLDRVALERGVVTASAGNMAQGVAWNARRLGIPATVIVPDHAPRAKLDAVERLGARIVPVPFDRWWQTMEDRAFPGIEGVFVHPFADPAVMAGNGTIGLEIVEDLPQVAAVVVPFGGGGLSVGIASAVKALNPEVRVYSAEVETGAPMAASLARGGPASVDYRPSWVDGIAAGNLLPAMWPLASSVLDGSIIVTLHQVAEALRLLVSRARLIAEGAGAAALAAALTGQAGSGPVVAVVSGGNIDPQVLARILRGEDS